MKKLILIGGGGHCKSCIDVIEATGDYEILGVLDRKEKVGQEICGYEIIGTDDYIENLQNKDVAFLITVGQIKSADARVKLFEKLKVQNRQLATVIAPSAIVSKRASIGEGSIIMHQCVINSDTRIGENCIINNKALIEHDVVVGNNCHISTGAIINGGVNIGDNVFFGSGAVSKEYIRIGDNSFIKANSIVK